MISAEVATVLERVKQNTSLVQSVDLGLKAQAKQIADLQAKIDSMPAGGVLSQEDKDALTEAAGDLDQTNTQLQSDIPANTQADPAVNAGSGSAGQQQGSQGGAPADAQGEPKPSSDAPKPLPGTGQS